MIYEENYELLWVLFIKQTPVETLEMQKGLMKHKKGEGYIQQRYLGLVFFVSFNYFTK